jgi:hypothetical protein
VVYIPTLVATTPGLTVAAIPTGVLGPFQYRPSFNALEWMAICEHAGSRSLLCHPVK